VLLPLVAELFTASTDRDLLPSERRELVRTHRTCVFGYHRRSDGPAMSVVYYVPTDDDELLVSTMAGRSEAIAVARPERAAVDDERSRRRLTVRSSGSDEDLAHVGTRLDGRRVAMSVGGPCPHQAVQAEGHDHNDGEDHEFHGRSLLPRGVADE
jgi:hypothetical protein